MQEGDRIIHEPGGRIGIAGEFLQDGDVCVTWDDGTTGQVMWNNCGLIERAYVPLSEIRAIYTGREMG
jgi:hypothetical protein